MTRYAQLQEMEQAVRAVLSRHPDERDSLDRTSLPQALREYVASLLDRNGTHCVTLRTVREMCQAYNHPGAKARQLAGRVLEVLDEPERKEHGS